MNLSVSLLLVVFFLGCGQEKIAQKERYGLPPRYKIVCNPQGTQFIPVMPGGHMLYKNSYNHQGYDSYEAATSVAWEQYEFVPSPPDTVTWQECFNDSIANNIIDTVAAPDDTSMYWHADTSYSEHPISFMTATPTGENISPEKFRSMHNVREYVLPDTSLVGLASDDTILEIDTDNIFADVDSGKIPIIRSIGAKRWKIYFEFPPGVSFKMSPILVIFCAGFRQANQSCLIA